MSRAEGKRETAHVCVGEEEHGALVLNAHDRVQPLEVLLEQILIVAIHRQPGSSRRSVGQLWIRTVESRLLKYKRRA